MKDLRDHKHRAERKALLIDLLQQGLQARAIKDEFKKRNWSGVANDTIIKVKRELGLPVRGQPTAKKVAVKQTSEVAPTMGLTWEPIAAGVTIDASLRAALLLWMRSNSIVGIRLGDEDALILDIAKQVTV